MKLICKLFLILTFSFCLLPRPVSFAAAAEQTAPSVLSVEGRGNAAASPDCASVSIGVTTHGQDVSAAQAENTERARSIIAGLKMLGIDAKDIQTGNYSFRPTYNYSENRTHEIDGYTVDNTVIVRIRNIDLTGRVIDTALAHGANQINSLEFMVSDSKALRKEALLAAIRDAREKADIIASGLGRRITGIQHVSENTTAFQSRKYNSMMLAKAAMDTAVPVESGTVTLDASVHIEFILDN